MIPLPICRWRKESFKGLFVCHSAKFCDPPNHVSAAFCRKCSYADHEPPALLPHPLPCVHLGERVARECNGPPCGGESTPDRFVCFLHRCCTVEAKDQRQLSDEQSCATCLDYLPRDPFGPSSAHMLRQAEAFLASVPAYPQERYKDRGVVLAGGGERYFPSLYVTIRALRHVGCHLPIQVWYLGRNHEMPAKHQAILAPFDVECVDADKMRRRYRARRLGGWELKVFATLHSPFEELLFLDADCYPCRNPEFLFDLDEYRVRGAIFWADTAGADPLLAWSAFGVPDPRRLGSIESGQFVVNKRLCWEPLNLAWFYNDHSDYYYRYGYGDKHTFEVAWTRCARPFVMWEPRANWSEVAYLHRGPDLRPLFVHRCADKFRFADHAYTTLQFHPLPLFYGSLPMEQECWRWMSELARLTAHNFGQEAAPNVYPSPRKTPPGQPRFAIATLYTPEYAKLGKFTARALRAYAKRRGYDAIVGTASLDATRPPAWSKLVLVERYLRTNPACTWLMWIDADAVIANPEKRLEDLVDESIDFLAAEDRSACVINTGVFLVRNCSATLDLLRRAYAKVQYIHHPWWEQLALAEALRECGDTVRARVVRRRLLNALPEEYQKGDFIVHYAGSSLETKLKGVKRTLANAAKSRQRAKDRGKGTRSRA
jgi:hypothetical protein